MRVFHTVRHLPRSELARLTQIDYSREMAFIAERTDGAGGVETIGTVRAVADPDNVDAEFAIIVRSDLKHQGLGDLLLTKMIRYAKARGTKRLIGFVLRGNEAMLAMARRFGFRVDAARPAEPDSVSLVLPLQEGATGEGS